MQNNNSFITNNAVANNTKTAIRNNDYAWWVGQDGNVWANIDGSVRNLGSAATLQNVDTESEYGPRSIVNYSNEVSLYDRNRIDDPNKGNQDINPTDTTITTNGYNGNGLSAEDAAMKNRMIGFYDQQINDLNDNLNSLEKQLNNTLAGVKGEYDQYKNEQQSSYDQAKNDYDKSTLQNQQNLQMNRNDITNRASAGVRGLLRVLGAMGAGGGSVARYEAPNMVTTQANQEYSNAGRTYAQNQSNLDTEWGNFNNEHENDKKKLEDWYDSQVKAKKQENYEKGQSLLNDLVTAYGNRGYYGKDYGGDVENAYGRIADYRNRINALGEYTPANYTGKTAVYNSPELSSYNTGNTDLSTSVTSSGTSASSPLLVALQGLNRRRTNSPYSNNQQ